MRYTEYHCGVAVIKDKNLLKKAMEKFAKFEDAEEQGHLVRLPCAVGDAVYALMSIESNGGYTVEKMQVKEVCLKQSPFGNAVFMLEPVGHRGSLYKYYDREYGKTVFIKPEAAQEACERWRSGGKELMQDD